MAASSDSAPNQPAYIRGVQRGRIEKEIRNLPQTLKPLVESAVLDRNNDDVYFIRMRLMSPPLAGIPVSIAADLSVDYPFKPPKIKFTSKVFHPNVDREGEVCLPIVAFDNWKASCTLEHVVTSLVSHLVEPDCNRPVNCEAAAAYKKNRDKFFKTLQDSFKVAAE